MRRIGQIASERAAAAPRNDVFARASAMPAQRPRRNERGGGGKAFARLRIATGAQGEEIGAGAQRGARSADRGLRKGAADRVE